MEMAQISSPLANPGGKFANLVQIIAVVNLFKPSHSW
jgi:hypothetical protein